jgi:branched-chain amino acid transport system substrate-binding protein
VPPPPPSGNPTPEAVRPVPAAQAKVAALLPLSGPNAAIGQSLLDAMRLAFEDARGGVPIELLSRDTGGTPEGAKRAAESALQAGATLIVGPLLGAEVPAVAEISRGAGVPLLSFTNNVAVAAPGVYTLGILPQTQVDRLVGFARAKGARRFALVAPDDFYGKIVEDSFRAVVGGGGGGQVVAVERYAGNMNAVSNAVKRVAETTGGADAILLAGNGDNLLIAATFVPFHDIDATKTQVLIATVGWDDPRLQQEAALFGAFIAAPLTPKREEFMQRFKLTYSKDAPLLASLGYDAAALAIAAIRDGGDTGLTAALTNPSGFEGYDGVFRLRPDGTNQRILPILQFQRGGARPVEQAAPSFVDLTQ